MKTGNFEHVPLTDEEKDVLYNIYKTRQRFLYLAYCGISGFALVCCLRSIAKTNDTYDVKERYTDSGMPIWVFSVSVIALIVISSALFFLFKKVMPFLKDFRSGVKEKVPYSIVRKEYFPLTNQYYVALDDPDYMHHEIDEETYYKVCEGDNMYIYRAINSKYIFELNGRFTIL